MVGAHYPVHSVCEHRPTAFLVERVQPLLERHGASVYLSGHDHCAEHIDVGDGVHFYVVGAAHGSDTSTAHMHTLEKGQLKFYSSEDDRGGFASVSVGRESACICLAPRGQRDALLVAGAARAEAVSAADAAFQRQRVVPSPRRDWGAARGGGDDGRCGTRDLRVEGTCRREGTRRCDSS